MSIKLTELVGLNSSKSSNEIQLVQVYSDYLFGLSVKILSVVYTNICVFTYSINYLRLFTVSGSVSLKVKSVEETLYLYPFVNEGDYQGTTLSLVFLVLYQITTRTLMFTAKL